MKFTPAATLVKSEINTHLDADKLVRKMTFTPGKIAQTKINQPKVDQPAASQPEQDYVVISVSETVLEPNVVVEPSTEVPAETVVGEQFYGEQVYEQPVVEVSSDLAAIVY